MLSKALNILFLSLTFAPGILLGQNPNEAPSWLETDQWLKGEMELKSDYDTRNIAGGTVGDFDGDGHEDFLVSFTSNLEVCWNSSAGIGSMQPLLSAEDSEWGEIEWDAFSRTLWVERLYPNQIETYTFANRKLQPSNVFDRNAASIRMVPGIGTTVLDRASNSLRILDHNGGDNELIPKASIIADGLYFSTGEDERLILQNAETGTMGVSVFENQQWQPVTWWENTRRTTQWEFLRIDDGHMLVIGGTDKSIWCRQFFASKRPPIAWEVEWNTRDLEFWISMNEQTNELEFIGWNAVGSGMHCTSWELETGKLRSIGVLNEAEDMTLLLRPDLDGDGTLDILYPLPNLSEWYYYIPWGQKSRRLFHGGANDARRPNLIPVSTAWKPIIGDLSNTEEIWTHDGALLIKRDSTWIKTKPISSVPAPPISAPSDLSEEESCLLLQVPYLETGPDRRAAVAELVPNQWYHLVFQRDKYLNTEVWLDGVCLFKGKSADLRYKHNSIMFGTAYNRDYHSFGAASIDEFSVYGSLLSEEKIKSLGKGKTEKKPLYLTDHWDFETANFLGRYSNVGAQIIDNPSLAPGITGNAVSFDGIDDGLRVYTSIPKDKMAISCFFKLDESTALQLNDDEPHSLFTLYGLYNMSFTIYRGLKSDLLASAGEGPASSPQRFETTEVTFPPASHLVELGNKLIIIDASGTLYQEGALGWVPIKETGSAPSSIFGAPWSSGDALQLCDQKGLIHEWTAINGWNTIGTISMDAISQLIPSKGGAFVQDDREWNWIDPSNATALAPVDSVGTVRSIYWSPAGDKVQFGADNLLEWHPEKRKIPMKVVSDFYNPPSPWKRRVALSLLVLSIVTAIIHLTLGQRIRRKWNQHQIKKDTERLLLTLPEGLKQSLIQLTQQPNGQFDTNDLDTVLNAHPHDTDETRRARRSRFIRECNNWSDQQMAFQAIERTRDQYDRRRHIYALHPQILQLLSPDRTADDNR